MSILFFGHKTQSFLMSSALAGLISWGLYNYALKDPFIAWFAGINITTFLLMGKDKLSAKSGTHRTPEATLLGLAFIGGFPGLFAGRKTFKHKTSKSSFIASMWILFIIQLIAAAYFIGKITSLNDVMETIGAEKKQPTEKSSLPAK